MRRLLLAVMLPLLAANCAAKIACEPTRDKNGKIYRSRTAIRNFRANNPCPATGKKKGACPGYHVDHIVPLCACGLDAPSNMQWITIESHRMKTRNDVTACRKNHN